MDRLVMVGVLLLVSAGTYSNQDKADIEQRIDKGLQAFKQGNTEEAVKHLSWAVSQINKLEADRLYAEVRKDILKREADTGKYVYTLENTAMLEQVVSLNPHHADAVHVLAWVYCSYELFRKDKAAHKRAMDYAGRYYVLMIQDTARFQIMAAALYANGFVKEGDLYYDQYIKKLPEERREEETNKKNRIRQLHE